MDFLKELSLLNLVLITFASSVLLMWFGLLTGRHYRKKGQDSEKSYGTIITSQLTVVAFMIAFIFGMVSNRFDTRRSVILEQTNSIGTTFLRADLLPEPLRTEIRQIFKEYMNTYAGAYERKISLSDAIEITDELLDRAWRISSEYVKSQPENVAAGIYIQSLNETIDLHTKQLVITVYQRLPDEIWLILYFLSAMSMLATGFYAGVSGGKFGIPGILLAFTFTLMVSTISDLDRGGEGVFKINSKIFKELQEKINSELK